MGGYLTIPDHRKSNSLSTRALSNFSLCSFTIGLYCDGHNLMCYFKLQPCLSFLYLQRRVFLILPFLRPISNSALVINYVRISGFPSRQVTSQKLLYFRVFSLFNVILCRPPPLEGLDSTRAAGTFQYSLEQQTNVCSFYRKYNFFQNIRKNCKLS